jgi:hypothetical protein
MFKRIAQIVFDTSKDDQETDDKKRKLIDAQKLLAKEERELYDNLMDAGFDVKIGQPKEEDR